MRLHTNQNRQNLNRRLLKSSILAIYTRESFKKIEKNFKFLFLNIRFINQLDEDKAATLAQLEKDLNLRQEMILEDARKRIDALNEEANRLKLGVLREAQAQTNAKVEAITEQVAA